MDDRNPLRIYLAGPYTAPTEKGKMENVNKAMRVAVAIYRKGHYPFVPHLTHYIDAFQSKKNRLEWKDYMRCDLSWLRQADAMFFIGRSNGADIEYLEAIKYGIMIYYSVSDIPDVRERPYKFKEVIRNG